MPRRRPAILASDAERDAALDVLGDAAAEGRLTVDELSARAELVQAARTRDDLAAVTADLPRSPAPAPAAGSAAKSRRQVAVLSSLERRGRWHLQRRNRFFVVLGRLRLDLREAVLPATEVAIEARCVLGSVRVVVPEGVDVVLTGGSVLGSRRADVDRMAVAHGAPVVRLHLSSLLGSVEVRRRRRMLDALGDELRQRVRRVLRPPAE